MKRRGFFGAILGVAAAPVAAKAVEALEPLQAVPPSPVVASYYEDGVASRLMVSDYCTAAGFSEMRNWSLDSLCDEEDARSYEEDECD